MELTQDTYAHFYLIIFRMTQQTSYRRLYTMQAFSIGLIPV